MPNKISIWLQRARIAFLKFPLVVLIIPFLFVLSARVIAFALPAEMDSWAILSIYTSIIQVDAALIGFSSILVIIASYVKREKISTFKYGIVFAIIIILLLWYSIGQSMLGIANLSSGTIPKGELSSLEGSFLGMFGGIGFILAIMLLLSGIVDDMIKLGEKLERDFKKMKVD